MHREYVIRVTNKGRLNDLLDALKRMDIMFPTERRDSIRPDVGAKNPSYNLGLRVNGKEIAYGTMEFYRKDPQYKLLPQMTDDDWFMEELGIYSNLMLL